MPSPAIDPLDPKYRGLLRPGNWGLCVGSGICHGLIPAWQELTKRVVARVYGDNANTVIFSSLRAGIAWSLDALIQAALNHHEAIGGEKAEFYKILGDELYSELLNCADRHHLRGELTDFLSNPFNRPNISISDLHRFF